MLWPSELGSSPFITGGGECPGSCGPGEYLSWDLGILGPSSSVSVGFNEHLFSSIANGSLIPLDFELLDGLSIVATISLSVEVHSDSPLELAIDPLTPSTLYAGTNGEGAFRSTDGGENWTTINNGLTISLPSYGNVTNVFELVINPLTPSTIYAGTNNGLVFRSTDKGAPVESRGGQLC